MAEYEETASRERADACDEETGDGARIGSRPGAGAAVDISGDRHERVFHATKPSAEMAGGGAGDPAPGNRDETPGLAYGYPGPSGTPYGAAGTGTAACEERLGRGPGGEPLDDSGDRAVGSIGSTDPQKADPEHASVERSDMGAPAFGAVGGGAGLGGARD